MKLSILTLAGILIFFSGFGQTVTTIDSLPNAKKKSENIIIRCGGTFVTNQDPLYFVDGVIFSSHEVATINPDKIVDINVLKGLEALEQWGTQGSNDVILITTKDGGRGKTFKPKKYAFKVHQIPNENWITQQELYNAISAKVPSLQIQQVRTNTPPNIRMRGDANTIVIVDGVRYDASILNTLNPTEIESVQVSNFPGAQNFFINQ